MRRFAVWAGYGAVAALALGGAGRVPDVGRWSVVAEDADGAVVAVRSLPAGDGMFALAYEHSAYHAPAVEVFTAAGSRFTMAVVASPNEAVLDYYAVAGARSPASGWWVLRLDRPQVFGAVADRHADRPAHAGDGSGLRAALPGLRGVRAADHDDAGPPAAGQAAPCPRVVAAVREGG